MAEDTGDAGYAYRALAEGTATATSDLDLDVVLRDDSAPECVHSAARLLQYCELLSPIVLVVAAPFRWWF